MNIIPIPIPLGLAEPLEVASDIEVHEIPFGMMSVDAFYEGAVIREAFSQYFEPSRRSADDGSLTSLCNIFEDIIPHGMRYGSRKNRLERESFSDFLIRVRIVLDYPLTQPWYYDAEIFSSRLGEVFSIAHDMYRYIYDLDDLEWRKAGRQDKIPSVGDLNQENGNVGPFILNRAKGSHVWGHDISDLAFEYLHFQPMRDWPMVQRKKMKILLLDEEGQCLDEESETELLPEPLSKKHCNDRLFIGQISFGIGS